MAAWRYYSLVLLNKALHESNARYALVVTATNDGIWEVNYETGEYHRSPRWLEILGYEQNELEPNLEAFMSLVHPEDVEATKKMYSDHLEFGSVYDCEYRVRHKSGKYIWVASTAQAVWDKNGKPLRMAVSINDISERKRIEQEVRENEERFRDMIEGFPLGIQILARDSTRLYVNQAFLDLVGFESREEVYATPNNANIAAPYDRERINDLRLARERGEQVPSQLEYSIQRPDGSTASVQAFTRPIVWEGVPAHQRVYLDLTERKQSEQSLKSSEERFRSMFEGGAIGNIVINESGIIQDANPATTQIFGYEPGEMRGKNVSMLMPEPDSTNHDSYLQNYLKTGDAKIIGIGREVTGLRKNGETFPMHLSVAGLHLDDYPMFLGSVTDLTQYKALESQLIHAQKMEAVGQLTGGVAHDFNNMLAVTMANAQMLEETLKDDEDGLAMTRAIVKASQRGAELTHRLLAFSRKQTLQAKSTDLGELCEGMNDLLNRTLGETMEFDIASDDDLWKVAADAGQVENAVLNLAINASHAMPNGGKLTIKVENRQVTNARLAGRWEGKVGDYVAINVTDTGTGMPPDVIAKVFEPFFTTKEVGQGSGLGLSMVHGFAQQSGGFVIIESEVGTGTTISILLPRIHSDEAAS